MNIDLRKNQRGFKDNEYSSRIEKAHRKMSIENLDVLLITTPHNFRYFSGFDSYFWESPTRPWFLLIPLNKEPIAVIPSIGISALKKTCIKNIQFWQSPNPDDEGVTKLASVINQLNNKFGKIGIEMGKESTLRMPLKDYFNLQKKIKGFSLVDGSKLLWELRLIKSEEEINKIKFICNIASEAYENIPKVTHIDETERTICNKLKIDLINRGADHVIFMSCASGEVGFDQIIYDPTDKTLGKGKILFIDTGSTFDGYFCDFDRNFAFGTINENVKKAYEVTWKALTKGIEEAKPGKKCSDIYKSMNKLLVEAGSAGNGVGRMGHGFGLQLTEPPSIMADDNTILEKGMTLAIEPVYEFESGNILVQEEDIVITETGNEIITKRSPKEIPIIR